MAILIGAGKNQVPTNGDLGSLAYQNHNEVEIDNGRAALDEYQKTFKAPKIKPTLNLPFARMQTFDPRVTFTRASDAYEYKGDSVKAEENLFLYSEQFDNGVWVKGNATVTANQTLAPNSTNTADKLVENTANTTHYIQIPLIANTGLNNTVSFFAKQGERTKVNVAAFGSGGGFTVNLVDGTFTASTDPSITNIQTILSAQGFYRISFDYLANGSRNIRFQLVDGVDQTTYTGDGVSGIFIWGAQLEQRSTLTDYQRTTDRIVQKYIDTYSLVTSNKPRFKEIDPVTKERKGLLVEEARTNVLTFSNDLTNAAYALVNGGDKNIGVTTPFNSTSVKYVPEAGLALANYSAQRIQFNNDAVADGATLTASIYFKPAEYDLLYFSGNGAGVIAEFNPNTKSVRSLGSTAYISASIEALSNGWFRCAFTFLNSTGEAGLTIYAGSTKGQTLGDGYSGIYISQAQLEVGSFATSPILTTAAAVTRAADNTDITEQHVIDLFGDVKKASIIATAYTPKGEATIGGNSRIVNFVFGDTANAFVGFVIDFNNRLITGQYNRGVSISLGSNLAVSGELLRLGLSFGEKFAFATDGVIQGVQDISPSTLKLDKLSIGKLQPNSRTWGESIREIVIYGEELTADELAFLTRNTNE